MREWLIRSYSLAMSFSAVSLFVESVSPQSMPSIWPGAIIAPWLWHPRFWFASGLNADEARPDSTSLFADHMPNTADAIAGHVALLLVPGFPRFNGPQKNAIIRSNTGSFGECWLKWADRYLS